MEEVIANFHLLMVGLATTLQAAVLVVAAGSILGTFIGLGLLYGPAWLRALLRVYVDILRGLPLLVQIFIIFYVPEEFDITINQFSALVISLSLFAGAPYRRDRPRRRFGDPTEGRPTPPRRSASPSGRAPGTSSCPRRCPLSSPRGPTRPWRWSRAPRSAISSASTS